MILATLAIALFTQAGPPQRIDQSTALVASPEWRAAQRMRAADAAAAVGIPKMVAEASETGEVPPRSLYMPILDELYPDSAVRAEQQGLVRLKCVLTVKGTLEACAMQTSSGVPALDEAAFEVAKFARYSPWLVDRIPQARQVILPVRWVLAD